MWVPVVVRLIALLYCSAWYFRLMDWNVWCQWYLPSLTTLVPGHLRGHIANCCAKQEVVCCYRCGMVCASVRPWALQKQTVVPFVYGLSWVQGTTYYTGTQIPTPVAGLSSWVVSASDCNVRGHRFESHHGRLCLSRQLLRYSLGHGLCTFTAVRRSTQPSTLRGTVKSVSAYGLINNNIGDIGCGW